MAALTTLASRYVRGRLARGEIGKDTARQLESRLRSFTDSVDVEPAKITRRHIERWMERPGLSGHYRRARLSALRGFIRWCVIEGHMPKDPTAGIPLPSLPPLLPRSLTLDEARAITAAATEPRVRLAVLLMLQEALRRIEVARLQRGDIDFREHTISVRGKGGQGQVTARLPVSEETWHALTAYLATSPGTTGPLLRSVRNPDVGISAAWVGELVARAMTEANVKQRPWDGRSGHSCRHTAAQDLIDRGVDIRVVQRVLRHASIRSTEWYVRGEVNGLRGAMAGRQYAA